MSQWYLIVESISMWELPNCISSFKCLISCCTRNSKSLIAPLGALNYARQRKAPSDLSSIVIWKNKIGAWSSEVSKKWVISSIGISGYAWECLVQHSVIFCWKNFAMCHIHIGQATMSLQCGIKLSALKVLNQTTLYSNASNHGCTWFHLSYINPLKIQLLKMMTWTIMTWMKLATYASLPKNVLKLRPWAGLW